MFCFGRCPSFWRSQNLRSRRCGGCHQLRRLPTCPFPAFQRQRRKTCFCFVLVVARHSGKARISVVDIVAAAVSSRRLPTCPRPDLQHQRWKTCFCFILGVARHSGEARISVVDVVATAISSGDCQRVPFPAFQRQRRALHQPRATPDVFGPKIPQPTHSKQKTYKIVPQLRDLNPLFIHIWRNPFRYTYLATPFSLTYCIDWTYTPHPSPGGVPPTSYSHSRNKDQSPP